MSARAWAWLTVIVAVAVLAKVPEARAQAMGLVGRYMPGGSSSPAPALVTGRPGQLAGPVRPALVMPRDLPRAVAAARATRARFGVPVAVSLGQAMHESRDRLDSGLAKRGRNYFGVKCGQSPYAAGCIRMDTVDYSPGRGLYTNRGAAFRAYRSPEASWLDYGRVLSLPRYAAAHRCARTDPACWLRAIERAGYASPGYAGRVLATINRNDLRGYDR